MDSETRKEFNRLSKLTAFEGKSEEFIIHEAQKNVTIRELVRNGNFLEDDPENPDLSERKFAKALFDKYLNNYDFENQVDLATLGVLVYNEVLVQRLQKSINKQQDSKGNFYLNDKMVKSLHDTQNHCLELKKQLGLDKEKSENELTAWQIEKKKLDLHIAFNRNEYTTVCENCGELLLLRRKCGDKFENLKSPFFAGRFWYNRRGIELVKRKIWTKEQYAWVFHTNIDFVNYCIENEGKIVEVEGFTKEEVEKFINSKDYLKKSKMPKNILDDKNIT